VCMCVCLRLCRHMRIRSATTVITGLLAEPSDSLNKLPNTYRPSHPNRAMQGDREAGERGGDHPTPWEGQRDGGLSRFLTVHSHTLTHTHTHTHTHTNTHKHTHTHKQTHTHRHTHTHTLSLSLSLSCTPGARHPEEGVGYELHCAGGVYHRGPADDLRLDLSAVGPCKYDGGEVWFLDRCDLRHW
jgi:hypothetical protein